MFPGRGFEDILELSGVEGREQGGNRGNKEGFQGLGGLID
jgi:hypothetical protein